MADKKSLLNPFPGLRPFQSDEEHLFFGRENQTLELLQILRDNRFVGVIGTSGSGKSSLVRCGLLSELYGGSFLDAGTDWEVAVMNPGGGPFSQLSKALVSADIYDSEEDDIHLKLNATLRRSRLGLVEAIRQSDLPEGTNVLLVVDQFEEIFRYSEAGEEEGEAADDFVSMILEAAKQTSIPIYVIITMRSDYIGDCSKFEGLPEEINEGEYLIPRLSREEYKSVIEGPIKVGGGKLAPRLLQRLLNDIGTESDQLPCLQHALMRTWDAWADRDGGEELDLEDYRAIGGMGKALSIHADEIFETFSDQGTREAATRMFRAITEKGDDNRGIRRPLRLQQLADITNHSIEEVKSIVDPYRQQGVTFLMPPSNRELEPETVVDISHESLMRVWQRLRNWVEEEAQSARIYRRLVDTSSLWKKEEAGLYHDPDLQIAQSWRDEYEPNDAWADLYGGGFEVATEFLEASEEEGRKAEREKELARQKELEQAQELAETRERSARTMKRFAAVVGVVALIALGAMVFAMNAQKQAVIAQDEAVEAKGLAESAKENLRKEFINSDINLGISFSEQDQPGRSIAHFARALERGPNSPELIDRSFNLLAYTKPSGYLSPLLKSNDNEIQTSTATSDGSIVITGVYTNNEEINKTPNLFIWRPNLTEEPPKAIHVGPGRFQWGNDISISPDGKTAALALQGIHILNIEDGTTKEVFTSVKRLNGVQHSPDGTKLLTATGDTGGEAHVLNSKTGKLIKSYETKSPQPKWSPDGTKLLFNGHRHGKSAILDLITEKLQTFDHPGLPRIAPFGNFDPLSRRFISISRDDQKFNIWNISTGKLEFSLQHRKLENNWNLNEAVGVFTPDNQKIITIAKDFTVRLWSATDGALSDTVNIASSNAFGQDPIFSDDAKRIIIPLENGQAYIGTFDKEYSKLPSFSNPVTLEKAYAFLANDGQVKPLNIPLAKVTSGALIEATKEIFVGTSEGTAAIFDLSTGEIKSDYIRHNGILVELAATTDGNTLATASSSGSIMIWNRENLKKPISIIGEDDPENATSSQKIKFLKNGAELLSISGKGTNLWNTQSSELITNYNFIPSESLGSTSKDEKYTILSKDDRLFLLNNTEASPEEKKLLPFTGFAGGKIDSVITSEDGRLVISGTSKGKVNIWSTSERAKMIEYKLLDSDIEDNIETLTLHNNSNMLAAGCKSGNVYLIDLKNSGNLTSASSSPEGESAKMLIDGAISTKYLNWEQNSGVIVTLQEASTVNQISFISADDVVGRDPTGFIIYGTNDAIVSKENSLGNAETWTEIYQEKLEFPPERGSEEKAVFKNKGKFKSYKIIFPNSRNQRNGIQLSELQLFDNKQKLISNEDPIISVSESQIQLVSKFSFKGNGPCLHLAFDKSGARLAGIFRGDTENNIQIWDTSTNIPITNQISNASELSKISFLNGYNQIIAWPDSFDVETNGVATLWDVSITDKFEANEDYSEIIKALGGQELNEASRVTATTKLSSKISLIDKLEPSNNLNHFFKWNLEFPSHRSDSPFRQPSSDKYFEQLLSQDDFNLIDEATRIRTQSGIAHAKKAALRLAVSDYPNDSTKDLALSEIIRALNLNPESDEVLLYAATVYESLGYQKESESLFSRIISLDGINIDALLSLISVQDKLNTNDESKRMILNLAIAKVAKSDSFLREKLTIKRFESAVNSGDFIRVLDDWNLIKDWKGASDSFGLFLKAVENEADKLIRENRYNEAIDLIKPSAIASLTDTKNQNFSSLLTKLIELENRDNPPFTIVEKDSIWHYLDDGNDPGTNWFELSAATQDWSKGKAKFGYGDDGEITTLSYGADLGNKHLAYYFKHEFEINSNSIPNFLTIKLMRDDGAVVYLNGTEVLRSNMARGEINHLTEASGTAGPNGDELKFLTFSANGNLLKPGKNVIAVQVHQVHGRSSDVGFQLELLGSNQDIPSYLVTQLKDENRNGLLEASIKLLPIDYREDAKKAWSYNLRFSDISELESSTLEARQLAIILANKLKSRNFDELVASQVSFLEKTPTGENLAMRAKILNYKLNNSFGKSADKKAISELIDLIVSPPRTKNLSSELIDLSEYYNASMFHFSGWWGSHEGDDLRTLPEQYDQSENIPFDLRGIIQLNSAKNDEGKTANDNWRIRREYPEAVRGVNIEKKANKIHFLTGLLFGDDIEIGQTAMKVKIHFEDNSQESFSLRGKVDVFDYWIHTEERREAIERLDTDKIGWIGTCARGHDRALTKFSWENPHPDKKVSHLDFEGGLANAAPFIVAITME